MSNSTPDTLLDDYLTLVDDSCVAILPHLVRIAAELDLAEHLADGTRPVEELAGAVGADTDSLHRLLRALASVGMVDEVAPGSFALTPSGHRLRDSAENSVRASVLNIESQLAWIRGIDTIRSGRSVFHDAHGGEFFAHKNTDADANRAFLRRMRERTGRLYSQFAETFDWQPSRVVMDIGGGDGFLIDRILRSAGHLDGVLFDRSATVELIERDGRLRSLENRLRLEAGDFFTALPGGADTHLMCSVLHDWDDEQTVRILRNSRSALAHGGRLLIVEMLVPEGNGWHPSKWSDIGMMVLTGGRERSAAEFEELLNKADFTLSAVHSIPGSHFSVLEAQ
ncbi:methyltransferase [Streptomyces sp. NPDC048595]|uniref:methyltransferase n=1 Tax=Streptomyces sp. NPDC048595 TaxID=3365576 RepID=UPI0037131D3B